VREEGLFICFYPKGLYTIIAQEKLRIGDYMAKCFFRSIATLCLLVSLLLILVALFAVYTYASHANPAGGSSAGTSGESKELNIELVPPEVYEYTSIFSMFAYEYVVKYNTATEGTFSVESSRSRYKNSMDGTLSVRNLEYLKYYDEIYEAWLVDIDTGYQLSLGLFIVNQDGEARFTWIQPSYINEYDMIVVTKEQYPDHDPRPSGDVVLVGYFDTSSLTKSSVSRGSQATRDQYSQYGELSEDVYG
jgi:hypothetical protein